MFTEKKVYRFPYTVQYVHGRHYACNNSYLYITKVMCLRNKPRTIMGEMPNILRRYIRNNKLK